MFTCGLYFFCLQCYSYSHSIFFSRFTRNGFEGQLNIELNFFFFVLFNSPFWLITVGVLADRLEENALQLPAPILWTSNRYRWTDELNMNDVDFAECANCRPLKQLIGGFLISIKSRKWLRFYQFSWICSWRILSAFSFERLGFIVWLWDKWNTSNLSNGKSNTERLLHEVFQPWSSGKRERRNKLEFSGDSSKNCFTLLFKEKSNYPIFSKFEATDWYLLWLQMIGFSSIFIHWWPQKLIRSVNWTTMNAGWMTI